ncbi:MAG: nucleotide-binding protein [Reinekea sp.]
MKEEFKVFLSHGQSRVWEDVARYIEKELDIEVIELSESVNKGRTVIQKLDEESDECKFAIIIQTAEDKMASGSMRTRQNVVHEIGFFQGKFGLHNVLFLKENGVEEFSNIEGIVYEPFNKDSISSTYHRIDKEIESAIKEWNEDDEKFNINIKSVINSSNLPMAFFNKEFKVVWANSEYGNLVGINNQVLRGKSLDEIIPIAAETIAEEDRERFKNEQYSFIESIKKDKNQHPETTVNLRLKGGIRKTGWLHADVHYKNGERGGAFVVVNIEENDSTNQ